MISIGLFCKKYMTQVDLVLTMTTKDIDILMNTI
jgi:hypothetical protein